jgi:hypothetical protein
MLNCLWTLALAHAEPSAPHQTLGIGYSAGVMGFLGDLSEDQARLVQEAQLETLYLKSASGRVRGHLAIGALWGHTQHDGEAFPYPPKAPLQLLSFLYVANLCWQPASELRGCLGLGEGTVNINARDFRQDYGTWNYAAELAWRPVPKLSVVARGRFIGAVEQQVKGVNAEFSLYTATAGVAWTF